MRNLKYYFPLDEKTFGHNQSFTKTITCNDMAHKISNNIGIIIEQARGYIAEERLQHPWNRHYSWVIISRLQWTLACEQIIDDCLIQYRLIYLKEEGILDLIKDALTGMYADMLTYYPHLKSLDEEILCQLIALGKKITQSALLTLDIQELVKEQHQKISLREYLGIIN